MALYFHFNETAGDLVYSDKATYDVEGYTSLGEQTKVDPTGPGTWIFDSKRASIKTVTKDSSLSDRINVLTSMSSMFRDCTALASLDLSGFDTSNVTNMKFMFRDCTSLTSLDLSGLDTSNVTDMDYMVNMFGDCTNLRLITISDKMLNALSELPADQYYPASGGSPVAKADLTVGTWVRDEADLTKVTSIVQQAQMQQAISRRIGGLRRDLEARIREASALLEQLDFAAGGLIPVENGGTGATTAAQARMNLGITPANIGAATTSDVQELQDSLSRTSSVALAFSPYQDNISSHDFRAVRLPGGVVRAKLIWTLAQAIPAGMWHTVGTLSGEDLALVASSVEAAANDAAYFACSAGAGMCTLSVSPTGEVTANAVSGLAANYSGVAVFDFTPLPS